MTPIKHLLTACAVSALMTGAAFAQDTSATGTAEAGAEAPASSSADSAAPADAAASTDTSVNADAATTPSMSVDSSSSTMGSADAATAESAPAPAMMAPTADSSQLKSGDPGVTSNQPIADTAENRAKYGAPMSNAGKRSAAKGN